MLMADVMSIALAIVGFLAAMQGQWLMSRALWPDWSERATMRCGGSLLWLAIWGIPLTLAMVVLLSIANAAGGVGQALAVGFFGLWWMFAGVGVAGLATHIGRRMTSPVDVSRPWKATVRGGVALQLAILLPLIGWFGLLPLALLIGTGAATLSLRKRARKPAIAELPGSQTYGGIPVEPSAAERMRPAVAPAATAGTATAATVGAAS